MTLIPNTDYVYEYYGDLFLTHHSDNYKLSDIQKLTCTDPANCCTIWTYTPTSTSHKSIIFHELESYKVNHIELFI